MGVQGDNLRVPTPPQPGAARPEGALLLAAQKAAPSAKQRQAGVVISPRRFRLFPLPPLLRNLGSTTRLPESLWPVQLSASVRFASVLSHLHGACKVCVGCWSSCTVCVEDCVKVGIPTSWLVPPVLLCSNPLGHYFCRALP